MARPLPDATGVSAVNGPQVEEAMLIVSAPASSLI
jgi:hypothetical protein